MSVTSEPMCERLPCDEERQAAIELHRILTSQEGDEKQILKVTKGSGQTHEVELTPGISRLFVEMLRHVGNGDTVRIIPVCQMLGTRQASCILNISRPFLVSILEKGGMPYVLVGRHRRINAKDVFAYKQNRDSLRSGALDELAALDGDLI